MTSPVSTSLSLQIIRGKDFQKTKRLLMDKMPQFGGPGLEISTNGRRKPVLPVKFTAVAADGRWTSDYDLTPPDGRSLSESGLQDFNFDRGVSQAALVLWDKHSGLLLQMLLDILSPQSKAILELRTGPGGYEELKATFDTFGLWQLILATHLGASGRSKQVSLQELLQWKQVDHLSFPENLAVFRSSFETVTANFEAPLPVPPGYMKIGTLTRMIFLLGLKQDKFQREIENAYDQNADKTTTELMEICQTVNMERGEEHSSAFAPVGLAASASVGRRPDLGPFPEGGDPLKSTCPFCHKNGYLTTAHGQFHPDRSKRDCKFQQLRKEKDAARKGGKPTNSSKALVVETKSAMTLAEAQALVSSYTGPGYAAYLNAMEITGTKAPAAIYDDNSTALVAGLTDEEMEFYQQNSTVDLSHLASLTHSPVIPSIPLLLQALHTPRQLIDITGGYLYGPFPSSADTVTLADESVSSSLDVSVDIPIIPPKLVQSRITRFFSAVANIDDDSIGSLSTQHEDDTVSEVSDTSTLLDISIETVVNDLNEFNAVLAAAPEEFTGSSHHAGLLRAIAVAEALSEEQYVKDGIDIAPHLAFHVSDHIYDSDAGSLASSSLVSEAVSKVLVSTLSDSDMQLYAATDAKDSEPKLVRSECASVMVGAVLCVDEGLQASYPKISMFFDSGASIHVVNTFDAFTRVTELVPPRPLGGIGGGITLTHQGDLKCFDQYPSVSKAYYSVDARHNLLSLGLLQRNNFTYSTTSPDTVTICDPSGAVFDIARLQSNNLPKASFSGSSLPPIPAALSTALEQSTTCWEQGEVAFATSFLDSLQTRRYPHITAESRARADRAEALHRNQGAHASDDVLAEALKNGHWPELFLTAADIRINRLLRGPCVHCALGKMKQRPMNESNTPPALKVAEHLHLDIYDRKTMSAGGKHVAIRVSDEFSGDLQYGTCKSKASSDLFTGILDLIHRRYTANGHRCYIITADSEPAFIPVITMLAKLQVKMTLVTPGEHEHFIENRIGSQAGRLRAMLSALPFHLPAEYEPYAERWIYQCSNGMPNSRSAPSTPDILVTGCPRVPHYKLPHQISFGTMCTVLQSLQKRQKYARDNDVSLFTVDKGEIGMCLGFSEEVPGDYDYLMANGNIVPRRAVQIVQTIPSINGVPFKLRQVIQSLPTPPYTHPLRPPADPFPDPMYPQLLSPSSEFSTISPSSLAPVVEHQSSDSLLPSSVPVTIEPPQMPLLASSLPPPPPVVVAPVPLPLPAVFSPPRLVRNPKSSPVSVPMPVVNRRSERSTKGQDTRKNPMEGYANVANIPACPKVSSCSPTPSPSSSVCSNASFSSVSSVSSISSQTLLQPPKNVRTQERDSDGFTIVTRKGKHKQTMHRLSDGTVRKLVSGSRSVLPAPSQPCTMHRLPDGTVIKVVSGSLSSTSVLPEPPLMSRLPDGRVVKVVSGSLSSTSVPPEPPLMSRLPDGRVTRVVSRTLRKRPQPTTASKDAEDHRILDEAILKNQSELVALAMIAAESEEFHLATDEYILQDNWADESATFSESDLQVMFAATVPESDLQAMFSVTEYDMLSSAELSPIPSTASRQIGLSEALRTQLVEKTTRTSTAEIDKLIRIKGVGSKFYPTIADLPPGTLPEQRVPGIMVFKDKSDGRETARLTIDGRRVPLPEGQSSYAAVIPDDDKQCVTAMMVGHCNKRGEKLNCSSSDVVGAFPRVPRPPGSVRLFIRIPSNLPHPWAGGYLEVLGAIYGLKESSRLFQNDLVKVCESALFEQLKSSPMSFMAQCSTDPNLRSYVSLVVDDVRFLDNCPHLTTRLVDALRARFTEITTVAECTLFAGIEQEMTVLDGVTTIRQHQNKYIGRTAKSVGIAHMPPIPALTMENFYESSTSLEDSQPADPVRYSHLLGLLTHALKTRHDIRLHVSHLAHRGTHPTIGDETKAIYILRYLYSTPEVGCVFNAKDTIVCGHSDSAFCVSEDGASTQAMILSNGRWDAPFVCIAKNQDCVAPDISSGEYYSANSLCLITAHFRQFLAELGWPQPATTLYLDSQSAINLANAPAITKKARHMKAKYHYIREMVANGEIVLEHIPSSEMRVDLITKVVSRAHFLRGRNTLLNMSSSLD